MRALLLLLAPFAVMPSSFPDTTQCDAYLPDVWEVNMKWTKAPIRTNDYTLRAGDNPCEADRTSYVPGEYVTIHLRTTRAKRQWRGLVLYAITAGGTADNKVGTWELTEQASKEMFWSPPNCGAQNTVFHISAQVKFYHHQFTFKAPPAGTGTIVFHTMIKRGEANLGEFYWANLLGDLTLTEAPAPPRSWYRGMVPGQSCAQVCAAQPGAPPCDATWMASTPAAGIKSAAQAGRHISCNTPLLNDCGGPNIDLEGWCGFPTEECPTRDYCTTPVDAATFPLCACGSVGGPPAADLVECVPPSPGSRAQSGMFAWTLVLLSSWMVSRSSRTTILLVVAVAAFAMLPSADAHNWIKGASRSNGEASTLKPCRSRFDEDNPHFQVRENAHQDEFEIIWATGHNHYFYWTVVRAEDIVHLANVSGKILNEYIAGSMDDRSLNWIFPEYWQNKQNEWGPGVTSAAEEAARWEKQHQNRDMAMTTYPGHFVKMLNDTTDPTRYIKRHQRFGGESNNVRHFQYVPAFVEEDYRLDYFNNQYPWIEQLHRFKMVGESRPSNTDVARIKINKPRQGPGKYIVQWMWRGYYDCIDVDVFPQGFAKQTTDVRGRPANATDNIWTRIDHCQFEEYTRVETRCKQVITTPDRCLDECKARTACRGINVVPLWNPRTVYPEFQDEINLPWGTMCDWGQFASGNENTSVCYGVRARLPNHTHPEYTISLDPEDPVFYSTCYLKTADGWLFDDRLPGYEQKALETVASPWNFAGKCVSCDDRAKIQASSMVPRWVLTDKCQNCDRDAPPAPAPGAPPVVINELVPVSQIAEGRRCEGATDSNGNIGWDFRTDSTCTSRDRCHKTLALIGWTEMSLDECAALARDDPDCSDTFMWSEFREDLRLHDSQPCVCYRKDECCGECTASDWSFWSFRHGIYKLGEPVGDPTCVNGIRSSDNKYCCPATCVNADGFPQCEPMPRWQVNFQKIDSVTPDGWWKDAGEIFGTRTGANVRYGWDQALSSANLYDFYDQDGLSIYSTAVMPGRDAPAGPGRSPK